MMNQRNAISRTASYFRNPLLWLPIMLLVAATLAFASTKQEHLIFQTGSFAKLDISEMLKITMHFPQVDNDEVRPSIRFTDYHFTEHVESVNADGSANIGITLDSFRTRIELGEGKHREDFFSFNSNSDEDLRTKLHDIRTLPRAQFLGQTLRFTVGTDGQIKHFINLAQFHQNSLGPDAEYEFVHAMLSISDSLRMAQLLEYGFGALAASNEKSFSGPLTATEIPITRTLSAKELHSSSGDSIVVFGTYSNAPTHIDYLEGLSANLDLSQFKGSGNGYAIVKNGEVLRAGYRDTCTMKLQVDIETVPEEIVRSVTSSRSPIQVMRGIVHINNKKEHVGIPKEKPIQTDSAATVIDVR